MTSNFLSYNEFTSTIYYFSPCNLAQPHYENVTMNISDGFNTIPYSFQIEVKPIAGGKTPSVAKKLEQKMMFDELTSSIAPGNIKFAK
jgi:hypothetical protein